MIKLFPHNARAYKNVVRSFDEGIRATCIIHPTGTGKSYVVLQLILDNPDKSFIIFTPSNYISELLRSKLASNNENVQFTTYQYLGRRGKQDLLNLKADYLILDEFHRVGANKWGTSMNIILLNNPNSKILGTSATPIRYLDGQRNMAIELFNEHISSNLTLNYCFATGILPSPKYVAALYSIKSEYNKLATKILDSKHHNKYILVEKLKKSVIKWEASGGIDNVIKRHLTNKHRKIIVFAPVKKELLKIESVLYPVLQEIYKGKINFFKIHSKLSKKTNKKTFDKFRLPDSSAHVIFSVDMLNEGIHIDGVDAVILMRDTASPNVFYQQIGRCLTAGTDKQPLIIDLVNNFQNICLKEFKRDYELEAGKEYERNAGRGHTKTKAGVIFIDETKDLVSLFQIFSNAVENWQVNYDQAVKYWNDHGHLSGVMGDNLPLAQWLTRQRIAYREGKLTNDKILLLEKIGIEWAPAAMGKSFTTRLKELEEYISKNKFEPSAGHALASWLFQQRTRFKNGFLTDDQKRQLSALVPLDDKLIQLWNDNFTKLKSYYDSNGNSDVPSSNQLWNFVKTIRRRYSNGTLPQARIEQLKQVKFNYRVRTTWDDMFAELLAYKSKHGTFHIPCLKKDNKIIVANPEYKQLYIWITVQRRTFKKNKMPANRFQLLSNIGFVFEPQKTQNG